MGAPIKNISRAEAIRQGKKQYFDGRSCPQGHLSARLVSNYTCVQCLHEKLWAKKRERRAAEKERLLQPVRKASGLPATCQEAIKLGQLHYFTGKPCSRGHVAKRFVSSHNCSVCARLIAKPRTEKSKQRNREYVKRNLAVLRDKTQKRYQSDIQFKLRSNIRSRIKHALNGHVKNTSALVYLGCTIPELKAHLEAQFQPGMSWENHNFHGWHIDHIVPLAHFDMTNEAHRHQAFHYTNLQPLWAADNLRKNRKLLR